jgi:hypothetical protein
MLNFAVVCVLLGFCFCPFSFLYQVHGNIAAASLLLVMTGICEIMYGMKHVHFIISKR